jgi:phenylalanyl-tRNA synthetase beta subunit
MVELLNRMSMLASVNPSDSNEILVEVPPTRSDILHACDIMEDVAIAYGYDNLPKRVPNVNTVAAPLPINKLSDSARRELALAGFTEVAPLTLVSFSKNVNDTNVKIDLSVYYLSSAPTMKTSNSSTALMMVPRLSSWQTQRLSNTRLSELLFFLEF